MRNKPVTLDMAFDQHALRRCGFVHMA
jgi:hypothetical protein